MAAPTPPTISAPVLSQKQRKAALRKEKRKRKRQALAQARDSGVNNGAGEAPEEDVNDEEDEDIDKNEGERLRLHEEWLEKERIAQEEFRLRAEREEAARIRKEEEERMIKEEWEAQMRKEEEEKVQKQQEKRGREEAVQKMLDEAEKQLDNGGPWMNPEAPVTENSENFGTERDVANCPFFLKTGACRFGERCSRKHIYPTSSPTLMIRGMFKTFGMEEARRDDYDTDAWLEHSEEDLQESFLEFYHDVLPELKSVGKVVQFKVSCNYEPHLRGNVYTQFDTEEQCQEAFIKFNGRWYAGRQLHCEMCPVTRWKNAICGLFDRRKCPKGKHCNFLHVFRNPGNEFWEADRDLHMSPDRSVRGSRRDGWHSERHDDRSWRQRRSSRSPPRSERSQSRRGGDRRRSRSRERRTSHQRGEDKWSSRSRHSDRRNDWYLSRSRDRSRSGSRDRELRNRSRDRDRYRKSKERHSRDRDTDTHRKEKERSRSSSREEGRNKRSRERSPKKLDKDLNDDSNKHRRHKQSKKSKKKSKKKHKRKRRLTEGTASSGESETDKESKEERAENPTATSPGQEINETELNDDSHKSPCVQSERELSPEVKSEPSSPEIPNEPAGKDETCTS